MRRSFAVSRSSILSRLCFRDRTGSGRRKSPLSAKVLPCSPFLGLVFLCLATLVGGCGGGSSSGGGGGGPTEPEPFVRLTPDFAQPPSVSMAQGAGTEGADLELEIRANELVDVQTLDFVLVLPSNLLAFEGAAVGPFLGLDASVVVTALSADRLQVLLTRVNPPGATGSGVALRVLLRGIGAGTGRLEFEDPEATTPTGVPIAGIQWLGASVEVSP